MLVVPRHNREANERLYCLSMAVIMDPQYMIASSIVSLLLHYGRVTFFSMVAISNILLVDYDGTTSALARYRNENSHLDSDAADLSKGA